MIDALHRSPAQVSALAAAPMPRWALAGLLVFFILPGLFGHDLWPQDATGFGRAWSMAQGTLADWLLPNVAGAPATQGGPLPYWFAALLVRVAGPMAGDTSAAAAANLFWYPLAIIAMWQASFRLARRDAAQPVAGAFGGEASRHDYARLIADVCVLLMIGTLGMIWRLHQTQTDAAGVAMVALALLATSLLEWNLLIATLLAGLAVGGLALTQGPLAALGLLAGCAAVIVWHTLRGAGARLARLAAAALVLLAAALATAAAWPLAAYVFFPREAGFYFDAWLATLPWGLPGPADGAWLLRTGAWFLWPLWPLAAWAAYAWRASLGASHLARPLLLLAALALSLVFCAPMDEHALVCIVPPLAVLAAFGATTLRRALDNFIDWMSIAVFSLSLVFFWCYYVAMQTGVPKAMAVSVARLTPGFSPHVQPLALVVVLAATLAWTQLITWRVLRRPRVLWRGPMLAAAGVTIAWTAANLLFLPAVDYVFSYRSFAVEVAHELHARGLAKGCVQAHRIPLAERAILAYYGGIRFDRAGSEETCALALHRESRHSTLDSDAPPGVRGMWELSWEGRRRARPDERWRIWVRTP
jgi:4-amino-4-deoxy-L-arabinose transferase-like glycosyltransferase